MAHDLMYTGKFREALSELKKDIALTHRDPDFLSLSAIAYAHLGQMQQADSWWQRSRRIASVNMFPPAFSRRHCRHGQRARSHG